MGNNSCGLSQSGVVDIVQSADKAFYVDLFYPDTMQPFDLTGVSAIAGFFPATAGTPIQESIANGNAAVQGAPGAGQVKFTVPAADSALMLVNPVAGQYQDFQINVTISGKVSIFILRAFLNILSQPQSSNS